jgi:hypothetical protein
MAALTRAPMVISAEMLRLARQPPPGGRWADRAHRMRIRFRSALAIALAAAALPAEATTATTAVPLTTTQYTDLGPGPIMLGANAGEVIYQISDSQPAANSGGYAQLPGQPPTPIRTISHIWAIGSIPGASASVAGGLITARIVSTIPMILVPSATIGANGAVSGITPALPSVYSSGAFFYAPNGAIVGRRQLRSGWAIVQPERLVLLRGIIHDRRRLVQQSIFVRATRDTVVACAFR